MKFALTLAACAALSLSMPAMASEQLAKEKGCLGCHKLDGKAYGPSYKEIAKKYKGDGKGAEHIVGVIKKGSKGVWGTGMMPPMAQVKEEDAKSLAAWILSL